MSKLSIIAAALTLSGLVSCFPPEPPPRTRPQSTYGGPMEPYDTTTDISPPPDSPLNPAPAPDPAPAPTPPGIGGYPTATKTANPNQVLSPFEPYNVIDVEGFKTGQLARDPSNQKIFRVP